LKTGAGFARGSSRQNYRTPPNFMQAAVSRFGPIAFDLAAEPENAQAERYLTEERDAFTFHWYQLSSGNLWLNPPFSNIEPWAEKCAVEAAKGARILFLTPASVGSNWFRDHVFDKAMVFALNGRLHFDPARPKWGYPKDCILSVYGIYSPGFEIWNWKKL